MTNYVGDFLRKTVTVAALAGLLFSYTGCRKGSTPSVASEFTKDGKTVDVLINLDTKRPYRLDFKDKQRREIAELDGNGNVTLVRIYCGKIESEDIKDKYSRGEFASIDYTRTSPLALSGPKCSPPRDNKLEQHRNELNSLVREGVENYFRK